MQSMSAKAPADKQQKIVTATPIEVMSLPHCVKLQLRQTARVAYPALQNRSGLNDHSQTPSQTSVVNQTVAIRAALKLALSRTAAP